MQAYTTALILEIYGGNHNYNILELVFVNCSKKALKNGTSGLGWHAYQNAEQAVKKQNAVKISILK